MNVQCLSCSSRYSVPDAKVQGRKVRIKCKRCSEPILIDGTHLGRAMVHSNRPIVAESIPAPTGIAGATTAPAPAPAPTPAKRQTMIGMPNALGARPHVGASAAAPRTAQANAPTAFQRTLLGGLGVARGQSAARPAAPPSPDYPPAPWTVAVTEEDQRELTTDQVVALYAVGTIDEGTYVWREGMDDWCSPFEAPDLRRALQAARISPREPIDSDDDDDDDDEAFDQSDGPIVPSSPLAEDTDDRRNPGMWHEPGRLGGGYDAGFEDVTVSMNEKETEGLLRKARRADFEDEPTVARGSARPHSPFAEASARGAGSLRQPQSQTFEFDEEEVTQAISTSEARASFDRHDNASQRAFELSQRKHGGQSQARSDALRASTEPPAARAEEPQQSSTVFSLAALTRKSSASSQPPAATHSAEAFPSSPPGFRQPPRPPVRKPPQSISTAPLASVSSFPPATHASSRPPTGAQPMRSPSVPPHPAPAFAAAAERVYPSAPPARLASVPPSAPPARLAVAPSHPPAPLLEDDSDMFPFKRRRRTRWPLVALVLAVAGAAGASFGLHQPLPMWAKIHELSGGKFPAWPELQPRPAEPPPPPVASPPAPAPSPTAAEVPTPEVEPSAAATAETKRPSATKERERGRSERSDPAKPAAASSDDSEASADDDATAGEEGTNTDALPEFDRSAAAEALGQAAASAPTCKAEDGPTGRGRATVTFANSGRATNANVTGTFAGTTVGGCIAELFRQARVPAFSGPPVKVAKSFTIE